MKILAKATTFLQKDAEKLRSFVTNPKTVSRAAMVVGALSFVLGGMKEKNALAQTKADLKTEVMNEMGDELMEKAMAKALKKLSESGKES